MSKAQQLAIGGIFSALSFIMVYMSNFMPLPYLWIYLSGLVIMAIVTEAGRKIAFCAYIVVVILCFMLLPNIARTMIFTLLIGYYPVIKVWLDNISHALIRRTIKLIVFLVAASIDVFVSINLLGISFAVGQIEQWEILFAIAVARTAAFGIAYDFLLGNIHKYYIAELRPKFILRQQKNR